MVDTGFVMARSLELSANSGRQLENMVFVELLRRGFDIRKNELFYYHTASGKEIDFVTKKGTTVDTLIQVAYEIAKPRTRNRELDALAVASEELKCSNLLLVTWDTDASVNVLSMLKDILPICQCFDPVISKIMAAGQH